MSKKLRKCRQVASRQFLQLTESLLQLARYAQCAGSALHCKGVVEEYMSDIVYSSPLQGVAHLTKQQHLQLPVQSDQHGALAPDTRQILSNDCSSSFKSYWAVKAPGDKDFKS